MFLMKNITFNSISGAEKLILKIREYKPRITVFNGKGIYEVFSGQKDFIFGKQPDKIEGTDTVRKLFPNNFLCHFLNSDYFVLMCIFPKTSTTELRSSKTLVVFLSIFYKKSFYISDVLDLVLS